MKIIISFQILFLTITTITFGQSVLDYQTGTDMVIQPGADVCADDININGTFSGGGTICGSSAFVMNLTAFIQGFYSSSSDIMVPDTITVYLRNAASPFAKVDSIKNILDTSGAGTYIFSNAINGTNYYIVLKHRNSIETWSKSPGQSFVNASLAYNLTDTISKAFGSNMIQVDASPVRFGIFSGDINQDGSVDASDIVNVFNDANNFVSGYVHTDVTGDDFVDATDLILTYNNSINFVSKITP